MAHVFDHLYEVPGTHQGSLRKGDTLFDIDCKAPSNLNMPSGPTVLIFILPPSMKELTVAFTSAEPIAMKSLPADGGRQAKSALGRI